MARAFEAERRQHIEQLMQLKQEALLAVIPEKDSHLTLLENLRTPREEIDTVRRHKDSLMPYHLFPFTGLIVYSVRHGFSLHL
ncbi:hypothetical protein KIN20_028647 [Parelaphostrongylus tenuis]|uniref:Uncharacterized protein n=1 Tax=Parelaphostrongylus tenuis TaxID=148309 RepID=A0AAD5WEV6_PARTN|nr:hypothetical protein KIN20_028618 [Parelaphostrongylus tenuis]KAJ1367675.1 hypothetical protein KIN20_028632 [Parelaphostrongylus tenuis]KAJ1367684.1 hypothetical protein KIN20_028641 [Parelaphostrongylus tenuis]KAJ1367689.1 hypothetical protein KIN20_028647 [Parelaphostrongylus tenuis]